MSQSFNPHVLKEGNIQLKSVYHKQQKAVTKGGQYFSRQFCILLLSDNIL